MQTPTTMMALLLLRKLVMVIFMFTMLTAAFTLFATSASAQYPSVFVANLDASQHVSPSSSTGTGFGRVTIDDTNPDFITVRFSIFYSGLEGKATSIQVFGPATANDTPTVRFYLGTAGGTSGFVRNREFTMETAEQAQMLRAGLFYFVVKTTRHPFGEIGGTILPDNPYVSTLNGAQNGNASTGHGVARISLNASETKMIVTLVYRFMTGLQSAGIYVGLQPEDLIKSLGAPDFGGPQSGFGEFYDNLFDVTPQEVTLLKSNRLFARVIVDPSQQTPTNNNISGRIQAPGRGPRTSDFDGDGSTDMAVWRPSNGYWYALQSSNSAITANGWGVFGDVNVQADYDGDGQTDRAVVRGPGYSGGEPEPIVWYIQSSSIFDPDAPGSSLRIAYFGLNSDRPVPGDYDGDGQTDVAVWRPTEGVWYISQSATKTLRAVAFGQHPDRHAPGDYDGDRKTDLAFVRSGSPKTLNILRSSDGVIQTIALDADALGFFHRDYDGDGKLDITHITVTATNEVLWHIRQSSNGVLRLVTFGTAPSTLVPADYDGDGKADLAVWRSSDGIWTIMQSTNGQIRTVQFGMSEDKLLP